MCCRKGNNANKDEVHLDNITTQDTQSGAPPRSMTSNPSTVPDGIYEDIEDSSPRAQLPQPGTATGEPRAEDVKNVNKDEVHLDNIATQDTQSGATPQSTLPGPSTLPDGVYENIQDSPPNAELSQASTSTGELRADDVTYYNLRPQAANNGTYSNLSQTYTNEGVNTYTGLQHIS